MHVLTPIAAYMALCMYDSIIPVVYLQDHLSLGVEYQGYLQYNKYMVRFLYKISSGCMSSFFNINSSTHKKYLGTSEVSSWFGSYIPMHPCSTWTLLGRTSRLLPLLPRYLETHSNQSTSCPYNKSIDPTKKSPIPFILHFNLEI